MLQFDVVTLFAPMFDAVTRSGVTGRARERRLYELVLWNPRDFAANAYGTVDDRPYGGGPGMVMMAEPLERAIAAARQRQKSTGVATPRVVHLSPQGRLLTHEVVAELAKEHGLVMLAGRYEGVDERLMRRVVDDEISIGDYVLSGGELAAAVLIDAIGRLQDGALNDAQSAREDSFSDGLLDCPHYTRPERHEWGEVPSPLLSGDHAAIRRWRLKQSLGRTWLRRPDLLARARLDKEARSLLEEFRAEHRAGIAGDKIGSADRKQNG
jgi:tRNA (guanine37-N1)-methyltransferase